MVKQGSGKAKSHEVMFGHMMIDEWGEALGLGNACQYLTAITLRAAVNGDIVTANVEMMMPRAAMTPEFLESLKRVGLVFDISHREAADDRTDKENQALTRAENPPSG